MVQVIHAELVPWMRHQRPVDHDGSPACADQVSSPRRNDGIRLELQADPDGVEAVNRPHRRAEQLTDFVQPGRLLHCRQRARLRHQPATDQRFLSHAATISRYLGTGCKVGVEA